METVRCPGELVISAYCTVKDISKTVTPDLKLAERGGLLLLVPVAEPLGHLGGTTFAQVSGQLGVLCDDVAPDRLKRVFVGVQELIEQELISAGHDVSDGGLITAALEMAFAGNCGLVLTLDSKLSAMELLFSETPAVLLEVDPLHLGKVGALFSSSNIGFSVVGYVQAEDSVSVSCNGTYVLSSTMTELRDIWEETSFALEKRQADPACVALERDGMRARKTPPFRLTYDPKPTPREILAQTDKFKVAVIREEGSNGDREMGAAFHSAGFEVHDVMMTDIMDGVVWLADFRGIAFVGGFSYGDVLDSAKGWAASIMFHEKVRQQFDDFYAREDTFSLGVCNGCQLMALLGWVPGKEKELSVQAQPRFLHNRSGRFESRFVAVSVEDSPAIMFNNMKGSILGVWVAHGEGRAYFPEPNVLDHVERDRP